jgi:hypothetical protein
MWSRASDKRDQFKQQQKLNGGGWRMRAQASQDKTQD